MPFRTVRPDDVEWITRPHEPGAVSRGVDVGAGELIHVDPGTPLQSANHGSGELVVYAYGTPPEDEHAEILDPVV